MFWLSIVLRFILLVLSTSALVLCSSYSDGSFISFAILLFVAILNTLALGLNFASLVQCYFKWKFGGSRRYWDE